MEGPESFSENTKTEHTPEPEIHTAENTIPDQALEIPRETLRARVPETDISRIVGRLTPDQQDRVIDAHRSAVVKARTPVENERIKTPEEMAIIHRAIDNVNQLREQFNIPPLAMTPEAVKIIETDLTTPPHGGQARIQQFVRYEGNTNIPSAIKFSLIQHEVFHQGAHQALQACARDEFGDEQLYLESGRSGLMVVSNLHKKGLRSGRLDDYLLPLNEAITEENARRFTVQIHEDDPELGHITRERKEQLKKSEKSQKRLKEDHLSEDEFMGVAHLNEKLVTITSGYDKEREVMWKLFDKIHEKIPEQFEGKSPEEVREELFTMSTEAAMTGNLKPLGRLVNKAFGKGSFRTYGHLQNAADINEFLDGK